MIYYAPLNESSVLFGRGAVVAQLTVNQLVAGSNPAARANSGSEETPADAGVLCFLRVLPGICAKAEGRVAFDTFARTGRCGDGRDISFLL